MESTNILIGKIKECNLAESDKLILIKILKDETKDFDYFVKTLIEILKIGRIAFKFFETDLE